MFIVWWLGRGDIRFHWKMFFHRLFPFISFSEECFSMKANKIVLFRFLFSTTQTKMHAGSEKRECEKNRKRRKNRRTVILRQFKWKLESICQRKPKYLKNNLVLPSGYLEYEMSRYGMFSMWTVENVAIRLCGTFYVWVICRWLIWWVNEWPM